MLFKLVLHVSETIWSVVSVLQVLFHLFNEIIDCCLLVIICLQIACNFKKCILLRWISWSSAFGLWILFTCYELTRDCFVGSKIDTAYLMIDFISCEKIVHIVQSSFHIIGPVVPARVTLFIYFCVKLTRSDLHKSMSMYCPPVVICVGITTTYAVFFVVERRLCRS